MNKYTSSSSGEVRSELIAQSCAVTYAALRGLVWPGSSLRAHVSLTETAILRQKLGDTEEDGGFVDSGGGHIHPCLSRNVRFLLRCSMRRADIPFVLHSEQPLSAD